MALRKSMTQLVSKSTVVYLPGPREHYFELARASPCWKIPQGAPIMYRTGLMGSHRLTDSTFYRPMATARSAQLSILLVDNLPDTWPQ